MGERVQTLGVRGKGVGGGGFCLMCPTARSAFHASDLEHTRIHSAQLILILQRSSEANRKSPGSETGLQEFSRAQGHRTLEIRRKAPPPTLPHDGAGQLPAPRGVRSRGLAERQGRADDGRKVVLAELLAGLACRMA